MLFVIIPVSKKFKHNMYLDIYDYVYHNTGVDDANGVDYYDTDTIMKFLIMKSFFMQVPE